MVARVSNEWISVEDRLPEQLKSRQTIGRNGQYGKVLTSKDVLVTNGKSREVSYIYLGAWQIGEIEEITHWMPLPEPPKDINHD